MNDDQRLTCERLAESLDDYLDGTADALTRVALEAHLEGCPTCPALVTDVRAIRRAAHALGPIEPPAHAWPQLQARLTLDAPARPSRLDRLGLPISEPASSRFARYFGWRTLQAAGAVAGLVLVVSSLAWVGTRLAIAPPRVADGSGALAEFQLAEAEYTDAIARLQEAADVAGPRLDALTTATLQSSIDDIDSAIGDAREALAREPGDALSQESLLDALGSKVALLQDTVSLAGDIEPGTEEQNP
jgi:anti-sigma factor RsiW